MQVLWLGQALAAAAALLPVTLAVAGHAVPDFRARGRYIGWWTTSMMAAMVVGPLLAEVIVEHAERRWIFLPTMPVALVTMAVAERRLPESRVPDRAGVDWPGQITAGVAVTASRSSNVPVEGLERISKLFGYPIP
ncbi:MFS transporter [Streptomyces sp. 13-12-16]|uniref:MFS transporter n=1 Tax=Streptomyces sp. 13-12-16 TaxID=1570823 RepID=UPI002119BAB3|nr:MFS transporter [Streptomyces sp. 13-12-16]